MSFYSFGRIKIISRNGSKSAVASAAYQSGIELVNEYDGVVHDYSEKKNVGDTFICLPKSAPESWRDECIPAKERVGQIWNSIEKEHSSDNARLARSNYIALPHSLTLEQGLECVDRFIKENCTDKGMGAIYTPHLTPGNHHVDVMYFVSEYDKNGKPKQKSKKEYLCRNKDGEEVYFDAQSLKNSEGYEKVYKYQKNGERVDMTPSEASEKEGWERINKYPVCRTIKVSGWDDKNLGKEWRKAWEVILNEKFEELGMKERVDCRSYKDQGLKKIPTIHEGWGPGSAERKKHNAAVKMHNEQVAQLASRAIQIVQEMDYLLKSDDAEEYIKINFDDNAKIVEDILKSNLLEIHWEKAIRSKLEKCKKIVDRKKDLEKINENYNELLRKESKSLEEKLGLIPTKSKRKEKELEKER